MDWPPIQGVLQHLPFQHNSDQDKSVTENLSQLKRLGMKMGNKDTNKPGKCIYTQTND